MDCRIPSGRRLRRCLSGLLRRPRSRPRCALLVFLLFFLAPLSLFARPTTAQEAAAAAARWLALSPQPFGAAARSSGAARPVPATNPDYYIVDLAPEGFALVAGDDLVEPIIAFSPRGHFDAAQDSPLRALAGRDLPGRAAYVRARQAKGLAFAPSAAPALALAKWDLLRQAAAAKPSAGKLLVPSDVRVTPLLLSTWGQTTDPSGAACYNYYTPPHAAGSAANYPTGCVATAMAQLMRFYAWPTTGVGTLPFFITYDKTSSLRRLRGGDGAGGPYLWNAMPLDPDALITAAQRQAIGALTYDAGVAIGTTYAKDGSGAYLADAADRLTLTFRFANAIYGVTGGASQAAWELTRILNSNLDAGYPVILGILNAGADGHAVVCDGYAFDLATSYHHLNLGWSGLDSAWYNLPTIDATAAFDTISDCIYNIYVSGRGEIVSGRVLDAVGAPVAGAVVTARRTGGATYTAATNARGIYALAQLPSNSQYTLEVTMKSLRFAARAEATGVSSFGGAETGNLWGVDFFAQPEINAVKPWTLYE